jgi:hypothetical protein
MHAIKTKAGLPGIAFGAVVSKTPKPFGAAASITPANETRRLSTILAATSDVLRTHNRAPRVLFTKLREDFIGFFQSFL